VRIVVVGLFQTKFGELWDKSLVDLLAESQLGAIADAGIAASEIEAIFTGNMCAPIFSNQSNIGSIASQILNLCVPSMVVEGACASGGLALRAGIMAIESGQSKIVLVNGVEKMTDIDSCRATTGLMSAASSEWEQIYGATFPALNALIARAYMHKFGLTREELARVSVQNHENGFSNPNAHLRKKISIEDVVNAPMIADPLTLFDCSPISDGAASLVLCHEDIAKKLEKNTVFITGSGHATDTISIAERDDLLTWNATCLAAKKAYKVAGVGSGDVDVVEVHDGFSITQILALEDLGFCRKGEGAVCSCVNVNPSGGLKSRGHPVGATGVAQAVEIVKCLQGSECKIGMTHNAGGCGANVVVHIFEKSLRGKL
jgi:acetyl-CoA C-acetyltransferase